MSREDGLRITSVFFDAAGTLFDVRGSVGEIYARIARRYGVEADGAAVDRSFRQAFRLRTLQGLGVPGPERLQDAERSWWFDVVALVFRDRMGPGPLRDYFDEVFEFFRGAAAWTLFPETREALDLLRARGCRLGIISNFDSRLLDLLHNLGIRDYFGSITLSWRAGVAKPHPRIFEAALRELGSGPEESVHAGDSAMEDFAGARGAGMRAILLRRRGDCRGVTPCARDLLEVCRLVQCFP